MIPQRLIRTVPAETSAEAERLWDIATDLHPDWEHVTLRDPIDATLFPTTSPYWGECESGAQVADLVRLEEIYRRGGVYIDSDVEMLRPFDNHLLRSLMFAGWQDQAWVCNAVFGARPGHSALRRALDLSVSRLWEGTLAAGVKTFSEVVRDHSAVMLLPPGSFYPYHWTLRNLYDPETALGKSNREQLPELNPWAYCAHHWDDSWRGVR